MSDVTCDNCGTINDNTAKTCELCGDSLSEERSRRDWWKTLMMAPAAWGTLALLVFTGFFGSFVWTRARYMNEPGRRTGGIEVIEVLNRGPWDLAAMALLLTVVLVGFGVYRDLFEPGED